MDANEALEKILKTLTYTVVFKYPEREVALPAISFFTLSETVSMMADNKELLKDVTVQIDIWAKEAKKCTDIETEINSLMSTEGWTRIFAMDNDKKSEVFNRTLKYIKVFTVDN